MLIIGVDLRARVIAGGARGGRPGFTEMGGKLSVIDQVRGLCSLDSPGDIGRFWLVGLLVHFGPLLKRFSICLSGVEDCTHAHIHRHCFIIMFFFIVLYLLYFMHIIFQILCRFPAEPDISFSFQVITKTYHEF